MESSFGTLEKDRDFKNPPTDKTKYKLLHDAIEPHVASFNALFEGPNGGLLDQAVKHIGKKTVFDSREGAPLGNKFTYWIESVSLGKPSPPPNDRLTQDRRIFPAECRERMSSYRGRFSMVFAYQVNDGEVEYVTKECGYIPIMVKSNRCHLEGLSPAALVKAREESEEMGGYFIINGIEKLVRMLIVQRRNHPMAIERNSFQNRGNLYSKYGIQLRSVRPDQSSQTNVLHYLQDGQVTFRFSWRKNEYLIPVVMILKALIPITDREIFDNIIGSEISNSFLTDRIELMLRNYKKYKCESQISALRLLGRKFRIVLNVSPDMSDEQVGEFFLERIVLVHLPGDNQAKANMLLFMIRKLYALVAGECAQDNPDSAQHQEILLPGLLYGIILKEKIEEYLFQFADVVRQAVSRQQTVNFNDKRWLQRAMGRVNDDIGRKMAYFLSTGNLVSPTGLDLQQVSGYTVVAEKINFHRFLAHFRMVHRGSFFAELKTTTVRKLLPESWGFLCPVHTPDGSPCGLLNHLAHMCKVVCNEPENYESQVEEVTRELGLPDVKPSASGSGIAVVQLNGRILGYTSHRQAKIIAETLRFWKVKYQDSSKKVPKSLEIGYVPPSNGGQYPGLYLFTGLARMIRPVKHLALQKEDLVGPFEQVYMNIAVSADEIDTKIHSHVEYDPTNILSILANMTPFSDFNQSPRNMYQCQMGKQTMGTPGTALACRSDNKMYRLQSGQSPIVRAKLYDEYGLDEFPNGTNAVVAVISYTGYDMDDAMILNKSAVERGFGHGVVYKTEKVDLSLSRRQFDPITSRFGFGDDTWPEEWRNFLDDDGLPVIGTLVNEGDPICAYFDELTGRTRVKTYHSTEPAWIQEVKLINDDAGNSELQSLTIKYRLDRTPNIGDKFSSRHGQKGVLSQKWPQVDMPFSESGISPDVIINPHAFPSRMTIGMFVESLAGKAGAMHGIAQDSTPWKFTEDQTAADYFGEQLRAAGYNYHGNEPMYSGVTGEELRVDIYIGVVFYQRLRHMVNDKFQVRSTGGVNRLTMQPVKGRKRGGGIRVGEMERDAFLGHGTAYLLQDRLLNNSDYSQGHLCRDCGSLITVQSTVARVGTKSQLRCRRCAKKVIGPQAESQDVWDDGLGNHFVGGSNIAKIALPFVLRYLDSELAAMGIRLRFNSEPQ